MKGADPKHALDDDVAKLESLFEFGKTTVHRRWITKDELERELVAREQTDQPRSDKQSRQGSEEQSQKRPEQGA